VPSLPGPKCLALWVRHRSWLRSCQPALHGGHGLARGKLSGRRGDWTDKAVDRFLGHEEGGGDVDGEGSPTGQSEEDKPEPNKRRINIEVLGNSAAYAEQTLVRGAAGKALTGNGKAAAVLVA
jgi:hypothetical protein